MSGIIILVVSLVVIVLVWSMSFPKKPQIQQTSQKQVKKGNIVILVHTCDGYSRYWETCIRLLDKYLEGPHPPIYFATECKTLNETQVGTTYYQVATGHGSWAQRLMVALQHEKMASFDYVLYMQEDVWLSGLYQASHWSTLQDMFAQDDSLVCVRLHKNDAVREEYDIENPHNDPRWYWTSHQPSIWRRDFLLQTLTRWPLQELGQGPCEHELRLNECYRLANVMNGPLLDYYDVSRRGKLLRHLIWFYKKENIDYTYIASQQKQQDQIQQRDDH